MLLLLSGLGIATFNTLLYKGLQFTIAINAVLMQSAMPLIVVIMSYLFFRDTITRRQAIGIAISFVGTLLIVI